MSASDSSSLADVKDTKRRGHRSSSSRRRSSGSRSKSRRSDSSEISKRSKKRSSRSGSRGRISKQETSKTFEIKISSLTPKISEKHLDEIFTHFGKISQTEMIPLAKDHSPSQEESHEAYVQFTREKDMQAAIQNMDGGIIDDKKVRVKESVRASLQEIEKRIKSRSGRTNDKKDKSRNDRVDAKARAEIAIKNIESRRRQERLRFQTKTRDNRDRNERRKRNSRRSNRHRRRSYSSYSSGSSSSGSSRSSSISSKSSSSISHRRR